VRRIGDGTLELERFKLWLRQDHVFLIEYARLLALAAARSQDLKALNCFATLLKETVETEMNLHRDYAADFHISPEGPDPESPAPTTQANTDLLLRVPTTDEFAELAAALSPSVWA
jgi:thiaminase/transcriptional activator TenA